MKAYIARFRWLGAIALAVALVALATACGSDPTPTPTPTATPIPTPIPVPTPTPEPPTPTPAPQDAGGLMGFEMTPATTGQDLMDRLSEEETACIQDAFGDAIYQIMLATPLMMASSDPAAAAPLFGCLKPESTVVLGVSFLTAGRAEWGPETRQCFIQVALEHPDVVLLAMGMDPGGPSPATEDHPYLLEIYACLADEEKVAFLIDLQAEVDSNSSTESDIINVIPESDLACIRDSLTDEEFDALRGTTVHEAFQTTDAVASCLTEEGYVDIFVAITVSQGADLSDDTIGCVEEFAKNHPHYVALVNPNTYDMETIDPATVTEIADDGLRMWSCYTSEELQRMQEVSLSAIAR